MAEVRTFVRIDGEIHGAIWQPGYHCSKPIRARIEIKHRERFGTRDDAPSVRDALLRVLDDGDFQCATFTAETSIQLEREWWLPSGRAINQDGDSIRGPMHFRRTRQFSPLEFMTECEGHYSDDEVINA